MLNKKKKLIRLLRVSAFGLVFVLLLQALSMIFIPKGGNNNSAWTNYITKAYIGERQNSIDVMLIGNSNLYRGFTPIDCWNAYGIASCDSGKPFQSPRGAYDVLRNVLHYQSPKVVVLETDLLFSARKKMNVKMAIKNKGQSLKSSLSGGLDRIDEKLETKVDYYFPKLVKSGFSDKIVRLDAGLETSISYYFPLIRFHDRWNSLKWMDFTNIRANYRFADKGFIMSRKRVACKSRPDYMFANSNKPMAMKEDTLEYLNKIIEFCKKNQIKLVLLSVPSHNSWDNSKHNAVAEFAKANNLEFVDLNLQKIGIDWRMDTNDGGTHLNFFGARKVTAYFGQYLKENYELTDHRGEPAYTQWTKDSKLYLA